MSLSKPSLMGWEGIAGFVFATLLELAGSMIGLIGTQGLKGNEPFFSNLLPITGILIVVNGLAAAVCLAPVGLIRGAVFWRTAVFGFMAGAVAAGFLFTLEILGPLSHSESFGNLIHSITEKSVALGVFFAWSPFFLPPLGGVAALAYQRRRVSDLLIFPPTP